MHDITLNQFYLLALPQAWDISVKWAPIPETFTGSRSQDVNNIVAWGWCEVATFLFPSALGRATQRYEDLQASGRFIESILGDKE
jgi:hypothetical protein